MLFAFAALVFVGCAARPEAAEIGLPATVKLDTVAGHPTVRATINGEQLVFAIDSGSSFCLISERAARRAGLSPNTGRTFRVTDITGDRRLCPSARVAEFTMPAEAAGADPSSRPTDWDAGAGRPPGPGQVTFAGLEFGIDPSPFYASRFDGILGQPFLDRAVLTFDAPSGRLGLREGPLPEADSLPLEFREGRIFVELRGPRGPIAAHLDTGNYGSLAMSRDAAAGVGFGSPPITVGVAEGGSGSRFELRAGRLGGDLWLGPLMLLRPIVYLLPTDRVEANVGYKLLRRYRWELDFRHRRMRLHVERATAAYRWHFITSPGFAFEGEDNEVAWVLPEGSAASAGLRVGDKIVSINGNAISQSSRPSPPRGDFPVVVRRGGDTISLVLSTTRLQMLPQSHKLPER